MTTHKKYSPYRIINEPGSNYCKVCKMTIMNANSIKQNKCYYCGAALDKSKPVFDEVPNIDNKGQIKIL